MGTDRSPGRPGVQGEGGAFAPASKKGYAAAFAAVIALKVAAVVWLLAVAGPALLWLRT